MYIARKTASTTDERSKGIDSQDPFLTSEIPIAGALINPIAAPLTSALVAQTVATLDTQTIGYGSFGNQDATDHYRFSATPGKTYSLIVTTDTANPNIRTQGFGDYFDIYFEDASGNRLTQGFQIKDLDLKTKLVEFTVPGTGAATPYYVQVDNAYGQPFDYAIALYDKAQTPKISLESKEVGSAFQVTFTSDVVLVNSRPRMDRIEVSNGSLSNLVRSADGKSYTGTFTPSGSEAGSIKVLTGAFFTPSGNPNLDGDEANNSVLIAPDTTPPKLMSITSSEAVLSGSSTPTLTFTFSEAVVGFAAEDVMVTGGKLSNFKGTGTTYTATLTPNAGAGSVALLVKGTGYTDASRSKNTGTEDFKLELAVDIVGPQATLTVDKSEIAVMESATLTIQFDEAVKGLELEDLVVTGGTVSGLQAVGTDGRTFTATLAPAAQGGDTLITVTLKKGSLTDAVGNALAQDVALAQALVVDRSPVATITSSDKLVGQVEKARVTITLSESSSNFIRSDLMVSGGTLGELTPSADGKTYTADFTPAANFEGTARISVEPGKFSNQGGQTNKKESVLEFGVDTKAPTVTITSDKMIMQPREKATLTLTFSEAVTGLELDDLTAIDGVLSDLMPLGEDGTTYTVLLGTTDKRSANIQVGVKPDAIIDQAGNTLGGAVSFTQTVDYSPTVLITTSDGQVNKADKSATITFTLSDPSSDFAREDITVVGGTLGALMPQMDGKVYTATFTPTADFEGTASVSVAARKFTNADKQDNKSDSSLKFAVDTRLPTVTIVSNSDLLQPGETATLTITFSEAVDGLTIDDLQVEDGQLGELVAVDDAGKVFEVSLTTTEARNPELRMTLAQNAVADAAGNMLADAVTFTQEVDYSPKVVSITSDTDRVGGSDAALITIELSEAVSDFSIDDLEVTGGTVVDFIGEGSSYTAVFEPKPGFMGTARVSVRQESFTGEQGVNRTGGTVSIMVDTVRPTLTITSSDLTLTKGETATITFKLSEGAEDFSIEDVLVSGGTLSNFSGSGLEYTALFTPKDNVSENARVQVLTNKFTDAFGNANARGASLLLTVDTKTMTPPPDGGGDTGGGDDPPAVTRLELLEVATVKGNAVVFAVQDAANAMTRLEFAGEAVTDVTVNKNGTVTTFTPKASEAGINAGILIVTNGTDMVDLGLDLALGTDQGETLSFADPDPVVDEETGELILVASALFGFGGDDILIEGASTTAMVGGEGVDEYRLEVGLDAPTLIVEAGSALQPDLIGIPGVIDSFFGFDLIRGFDLGGDTLAMTGNTVKVRGTFIEGYVAFITDGLGSDLMVFDDADGNGVPDAGEKAVVLIGVGDSADAVTVMGG